MSENDPQDLVNTLADLLENERAALLQGDVDKINRMAERKATLLAKISTIGTLSEQTIVPLKDRLKRNHELMDHALQGIRSAADRIREMRQVRETLNTYDQKGQLKRLPFEGQKSVEKRA